MPTHASASRRFSSLPRLVTSIIFQNLQEEEKLQLRATSSQIKLHVDDHIRREFIKWKQSLKKSDTLSHKEVLLLSIEQFTNVNFTPPYVFALIDKTANIASSSDGIWSDLQTPINVEERDKLLKIFYEEADKALNEKDKKIIFTLTLIGMLKALGDSQFTATHPSNKKASLRLEFQFNELFFAIPFYNYVFDWFSFDRDWIQMLLLVTKFLEIKAAVAKRDDAAWVNFLRPMNFEQASVIFGRKNPFTGRAKTPSRAKCRFIINADREMIGEIKKFIETGEFDCAKVAKHFSVYCQLSCLRTKVCEY